MSDYANLSSEVRRQLLNTLQALSVSASPPLQEVILA